MQMPWGKHKGEELEDIPAGYLGWVLEEGTNVAPALKEAITAELSQRLRLYATRRASGVAVPDPATAAMVLDLIDVGFRTLARKVHPDAGGSHEAMVTATAARDWLKSVVGVD